MIYNIRGQKRNPMGEGPRRLAVYAGRPSRPTTDGLAGDFPLCPAMGSVLRLRILSLLATDGPQRVTDIITALDGCQPTTTAALWGMRDIGLTQNEIDRTGQRGCVFARRWWITDDGRKWLWRFGWVTGRLDRHAWQTREFEGRTDLHPADVLQSGAHDILCLPGALATAAWVAHASPIPGRQAARAIGISSVAYYLYTWKELGWARDLPPGHPDAPEPRARNAKPWIITPMGYRAMSRHVNALRYAAQKSGYTGAWDDNWYENLLRDRHPSCTDEQILWIQDGTWWPEE